MFSKNEMDLKKRAKQSSPASTSRTVIIGYAYCLVYANNGKACACEHEALSTK
jgi:hypothetical protein